MKRRLLIILMVIVITSALMGCKHYGDSSTIPSGNTQPTTSAVLTPAEPTLDESSDSEAGWIGDTQLYCEKVAVYSGKFVEDNSDRPVKNVAVMLITNKSDRYLDIAMLTYEINGKTAKFNVTGLPAGKSAWVLESEGLQISENPEVKFLDSTIAYRDEVVAHPDELEIASKGNTLQVTNVTDDCLYNVYVYYKVLHSDGNYLGGITYGVRFGDLQPGQGAESIAVHYKEGKTEIIRVSWLDEPLPELNHE